MSRFRSLLLIAVSLPLCLTAAYGAQETIDFEGLQEGAVAERVFSREGSGPILVEGSNEKFPPGQNAAIIYDSSCPDNGTPDDCSGDDADLGTPNEGFDGPGQGNAGSPSGRFPNSVPLGNVLIIGENLNDADGDGIIDDPDDEGSLRLNRLSFDFSEVAPVIVHHFSLVDVNFIGEPSTVDLLDSEGNLLGDSPYVLPSTEDNGVIMEFDLGDTEGVTEVVVWLRGSGAIDNLVFSPEGPKVDIETLTNGFQADGVEDDDIPWIRVGQPVAWTYLVTNTGTVPLAGIEVSDDRLVEVSCPRDELDPGESMECTAAGVSLNLLLAELGIPTVKGRCLSRAGRPLYANVGSVSANGPLGVAVADTDPSHYCADPARPSIYVRKQKKGPDVQTVASGSDAAFKIVVWNNGTEDLKDIKVADVLSPDCNREFSRLAAGKSLSYTCTAPGLAIGGEGVAGCSFVNEVVATGNGDKESVTDSDTSTVELLALTLEKSFIGASSEAANFEIILTNSGCDLDAVTVTDPLAPDCERELGALAAGDSSNYACSMPLENRACAEGARGGAVASSCDTAAFSVGAGVPVPVDADEPEEGGAPVASGDEAGEPVAAADAEVDEGGDDSGGSRGLLLLLLALLIGGGLFAWNRMKAG